MAVAVRIVTVEEGSGVDEVPDLPELVIAAGPLERVAASGDRPVAILYGEFVLSAGV